VIPPSRHAAENYAEAEQYLLTASHWQQAHVLPQQLEFVELRGRLARLYRAWGKPDQAKQFDQ
jgi:hypothetical protein